MAETIKIDKNTTGERESHVFLTVLFSRKWYVHVAFIHDKKLIVTIKLLTQSYFRTEHTLTRVSEMFPLVSRTLSQKRH